MPHTRAVGIDVSKNTLDITCLKLQKTSHTKVPNSMSGINKIITFLEQHNISSKDPVILESTGDYHLLCAYHLSKSYNVHIINPLLAKHHMKTTVRKVKNDKIDSLLLAQIGLKQDLETHVFSKQELHKRKLLSQINALEKHISALKLSIKNTEKTLSDFDIHSAALDTIRENVKQLEKSCSLLQKEYTSLVQSKNMVEELAKVRGITEITASRVVGILEDRQFHTKGSVVAFAGLDISVRESGKWSGRTRLTKRGHSQLRKYLIQIGWGLLMHNPQFQEYIDPFKQRGRRYKELLVIIARKFLKMLYGSMKSDAPFDLNLI